MAQVTQEILGEINYPGIASPIRPEELTEAIQIAAEVLQWVEGLLLGESSNKEQGS